MEGQRRLKRFLEITPGALSWGIIIFFLALAVFKPVACAVLVIVFDFYWIVRTLYLTTLLLLAHRKLSRKKDTDWLAACRAFGNGLEWEKLYHLIIFPVYKEGPEILRPSLQALAGCRYPKEKMIVVAAFEERNPEARGNAKVLEEEFSGVFRAYLSTFHPDGLPGELRTKGANATWAAKKAREFIKSKGIPEENVLVSCFDADTCADKEYFACLSYNFLATPLPHQASYQPVPVYNNNIWQAPSFARVVEMSSSFCQMIETVRLEKFVTFSSHSMSFKTLVDMDYWPVDMVSDDSVVYWKAFLFYNGGYRVVPLYTTVSMDAAYDAHNIFKTIAIQYKQKRRWAWGVENFPFVAGAFIGNNNIPLAKKMRRGFNLLEGHVTWAVWAVIMIIIGPLPFLLGGAFFRQMAVGYNIAKINGPLFNLTLIAMLVCIILSYAILPPRPKGVSRAKNILVTLEWATLPFIVLVLGSIPALDAQTRLLLGKYMGFNPTEKAKKMVY